MVLETNRMNELFTPQYLSVLNIWGGIATLWPSLFFALALMNCFWSSILGAVMSTSTNSIFRLLSIVMIRCWWCSICRSNPRHTHIIQYQQSKQLTFMFPLLPLIKILTPMFCIWKSETGKQSWASLPVATYWCNLVVVLVNGGRGIIHQLLYLTNCFLIKLCCDKKQSCTYDI